MGKLVKDTFVCTYHNFFFLNLVPFSFRLYKKTRVNLKNPIHYPFYFPTVLQKWKTKKQFCSYDISLEVLIGLVCRISFLGDIIRGNYAVPLPMVNEVWQAFLLSLLPLSGDCRQFPETGRCRLDVTLWSFFTSIFSSLFHFGGSSTLNTQSLWTMLL